MNKHEIAFEFQKGLTPLVAEGIVSQMAVPLLMAMVTDALDQHSDSLVDMFNERIRDWETKAVDDVTLYSLGLRHAVDLILEEDPDRFLRDGTGVSPEDLS